MLLLLLLLSLPSELDSTTTHGLHSFRYACTTLWNRLPEDLRSTTLLIGSLISKCDKFRLNKYNNSSNGAVKFVSYSAMFPFIYFIFIYFLG